MVSENLARYIQVVTCNRENTRCLKDRIELDQGEEANIYIKAEWDELFGEVLEALEDGQQIQGYVSFQGVNRIHKINIRIEPAPLFRASKEVSEALSDAEGIAKDIPVNQQTAFFGMFGGGSGFLLLGGIFALRKIFGL